MAFCITADLLYERECERGKGSIEEKIKELGEKRKKLDDHWCL